MLKAPDYLYPQPRQYSASGESSAAPGRFEVKTSSVVAGAIAAKANVSRRLAALLAGCGGINDQGATAVAFVEYRAELHPQGYELEWNQDGLRLSYSSAQGLHYALLTAAQMAEGQCGSRKWTHYLIEDEPEFPVRGVMLDIGRNKIPRIETIFALIDRLSELKFNHLQLYMEGFCFDYKKYAKFFPDATPITEEEYRFLDAYALERFIDLVPNQNCLGHMGHWLVKPEFRELAEHPDGMPAPPPLQMKLPPGTLNPTDERSVALAKDLFDELLPNFTSGYVNINMDEPFGLGTGESKARAEEIGVGGVYLDYALRMFDIVRSHGKKTLIWGDVFAHHPDLLKRLPDDVIVLHWNYDAPVPYEPHCRILQENGVPYYVCPGTSSWSAITGRTDNMLVNIADAAKTGKAFGASGLIVTDWGDAGHWQPLAASYPGFAYAAGVSWQTEANLDRLEPLEHHVSFRMLQDRSGYGGRLLLEMGRYYHLERSTKENGTYTSYLLNRGLSDRETLERDNAIMVEITKLFGGAGIPFQVDYRYAEIEEWLSSQWKELDCIDFVGADSAILKDELANSLRLIDQGAGLHRYIYRQELPHTQSEINWLERLRTQLETIVSEFERLWLIPNREGGLASSTAAFHKLLKQYEERLREIKGDLGVLKG